LSFERIVVLQVHTFIASVCYMQLHAARYCN